MISFHITAVGDSKDQRRAYMKAQAAIDNVLDEPHSHSAPR